MAIDSVQRISRRCKKGHPIQTTLIEASDDDFIWMLGSGRSDRGLNLPPGGVDDPVVLTYLRELTRRLHAGGCIGTWMFVAGGEVVGLGGYKRLPKSGSVEIGYGVAKSRRRLGHATAAVGAILEASKMSGIHTVLAETAIGNVASEYVLVRNDFDRTGTRRDREDGELILWRRSIARASMGDSMDD